MWLAWSTLAFASGADEAYLRALACWQVGDVRCALDEASAALIVDPEHEPALLLYALALGRSGERERAVELLTELRDAEDVGVRSAAEDTLAWYARSAGRDRAAFGLGLALAALPIDNLGGRATFDFPTTERAALQFAVGSARWWDPGGAFEAGPTFAVVWLRRRPTGEGGAWTYFGAGAGAWAMRSPLTEGMVPGIVTSAGLDVRAGPVGVRLEAGWELYTSRRFTNELQVRVIAVSWAVR